MATSRPRHQSEWLDLPANLLGVVLRSLPSLADQVRLRAVCRRWRSSAATVLHQSPLQLPCLTFPDGTLLDVNNNTAHRVRLPDNGTTCYCAGENMLFFFHTDSRCFLMNTFSSIVTPLPELAALLKSCGVQTSWIMKVVMSSAPGLVAVLFRSILGYSVIAFASYGPDSKINSCQTVKVDRDVDMLIDIVIFQGKIHAISRDNTLLVLQLNNEKKPPGFRRIIGGANLPSTASHGVYEVWRYLLESNGRLLMVRQWVSKNWYSESAGQARRFSVVEANLSHGLWNNVDDLQGQTLFVSKLCSKSAPAADAGGDRSRQDCIYFLNECGLGDSGAYNIRDQTIKPLVPEQPTTALPWNCQQTCPAWFFPVEVQILA